MAQNGGSPFSNMSLEQYDALSAQMSEAQGLPKPQSLAGGNVSTAPPSDEKVLADRMQAQEPQIYDEKSWLAEQEKTRARTQNSPNQTVPSPATPIASAKAEPDLGRMQSFFGQFNDAVLYLPDAVINRAVQALEITGLIDAPKDERLNRNFLQRTFNAADYKTKEQIAGTVFNLGDPTGGVGVRDPYAAAAGEGAALGAAFSGSLAGTALRTGEQLRRFAMSNPTRYGASAEVLAEEAARAQRAVPLPQGSRGAPLDLPSGPPGGVSPRYMDPTQNTLDRIGTSLQQTFAGAPALPIAAEIASSAAGNVATEAEKEYTPLSWNGKPIVTNIPAMLTGAYVSSLVQEPLETLKQTWKISPTTLGIKKTYDFVRGKIEHAADPERVKEKLGPELLGEYEKATAAAEASGILPRTREIEEAMPGVNLSYAEKTLDPYWINSQNTMQANSTIDQARANLERVQQNIKKAWEFFSKNIPEAGANPAQVFVDKTRALASDIQNKFVLAKQNVTDEMDNIISMFPGLSQEQRITAGRQLQERIDGMKQTAKDNLLDLAAKLKLDKPQSRQNFEDLQATLTERFKPSATTDDLLDPIVKNIRDADFNTMNFQDYLRYREALGAAMGARAAQGGRGKAMTDLEFAKKELDKWAENSFGPNYAEWRDRWVKEYVVPFEDGLVHKITGRQLDRSANDVPVVYQLQGEMVAEEIIKQAQRGKIDDFNKYLDLVKNDGVSMQNLRNAFLDDMLSKVYNPQKQAINPQALKTYAKDNEVFLARLGMKDEVENIASAGDALTRRIAGLDSRAQVIKRDQLVKLLETVNKQGLTAEETVDNLIKSPSKLGEFWTRLKTPGEDGKVDKELLDAFTAAVMNRVAQKYKFENPSLANNAEGLGAEAFMKAMDENREVFRKIMTPEQFENYRLVNDALFRIAAANENLTTGSALPLSFGEKFKKATGTQMESAASLVRQSELAGKVGPTFIAAILGRKFLAARNQAAFDEMQRRALYDRDFADLLATPVRPDGSIPMEAEKKLRGYMVRSMIPPGLNDRLPDQDFGWDPETSRFVPIGQPSFQRPAPPTPLPIDSPFRSDRGIINFGAMPQSRSTPIQVPTVAPVPVNPAPAPVSTPAPTQTTPPQPRPLDIRGLPPAQQNQTPGKQGMIYQNMFPNDPLGSLLAAKRAG